MIDTRFIPPYSRSLLLLVMGLHLLMPPTAEAQSVFSSIGGTNQFDRAVAVPYPLPIAVSGLGGTLTDFSATLSGVTANGYSGDLAALLVGPSGQSTLLLGGNTSGGSHGPVNWTFTPSATTLISVNGLSGTGTYLPNQNNNSLSFPGTPAPTPYGKLTDFIGTDPNGIWNLFLRDQVSGGAQQLSGWFLSIFAAPTGPTPEELQLFTSAIPTNQVIGRIAANVHNLGTRGIGNRLFRSRGRTTTNDGITQSNANRGQELFASRSYRMEQALRMKTTINLEGPIVKALPRPRGNSLPRPSTTPPLSSPWNNR
ncbi:MAG TPA: proprotein convertase P-domain-containing protein, partial [Verrucomicrobiales bacterium]|nr:proprotein convertase P-domain-containing protein [Verrucomicrobiales bacterium]